MDFDLYGLWQKTSFIIVHYTSLWLLIVLFGTALASWYLASILDKQNAIRQREAKLARKTAAFYTVIGLTLWLFSFIMGQ